MFSVVRLVCLCVVVAVAVVRGDHKEKDKPMTPPVKIDVYYESLCPDSITFITKQLYPTYEELGKYMDVTFLPFGRANYVKNENGSGMVFDCKHGDRECDGDKVQACALKHLEEPKDKMKFVNCVMDEVKPKDNSSEYPGEKCAKKLTLTYDKIKTCANSTDEIDMLLTTLKAKTAELVPKLKSVPTIVFKSKFKDTDQTLAIKDFRRAVCSYIGGSKEHPKECKSGATANQAAILTAIFAAIFLKVVS